MFAFDAEAQKNFVILRLTGEVLLPDAPEFQRQLEKHSLAPHCKQTVLDLSLVRKMDAAGLGVLISISTMLQGRGRRLVLLCPAKHVTELIRKSEVESFFPTFENEEELKALFMQKAG